MTVRKGEGKGAGSLCCWLTASTVSLKRYVSIAQLCVERGAYSFACSRRQQATSRPRGAIWDEGQVTDELSLSREAEEVIPVGESSSKSITSSENDSDTDEGDSFGVREGTTGEDSKAVAVFLETLGGRR